MGLVGGVEAEGAAREGMVASGRAEEDEVVARSYHDTVFSGKLWQAVRWENYRGRVGCLLPDDQCTKTGRTDAEVLQENHLDVSVSPV